MADNGTVIEFNVQIMAGRDLGSTSGHEVVLAPGHRGRVMGVVGEAAERRQQAVERHIVELDADAGFVDPLSLATRRAGGDAGHVPGCARDHALDTACSAGGTSPADVHEAAILRVEDARAALLEMLRAGYALDEGQVATVLRCADALAAGVGLDAREALRREMAALVGDLLLPMAQDVIAERLFAIGRASVVPPDADLARVIAAWRTLDAFERTRHVAEAEIAARAHWRDVVGRILGGRDGLGEHHVTDVMFVGSAVYWCIVDGEPATPEQWANLREAGVPVADGVGM